MKRICLLTNIPTPYREPIHELISQKLDGYHVIYCQEKEANREWEFRPGTYSRTFLKNFSLSYKGSFIYMNPDVWTTLNYFKPEIVITSGFSPTFLFAFFWCAFNRKKHICMTDGWLKSEANLSYAHRLIRKLVFKHSVAFIGASKHSLDLYRFYKCPEEALFQSHLCVNNQYFSKFIHEKKEYDIMFSGQFIEGKMPSFFCQVAKKIKEKKKSCSALVLGSGPLKNNFLTCLRQFGIRYYYPGFVQQDNLPSYYASSRVFLFPTLNDAWGVVVNEACASGIPVITCTNAGVANDLIQHGKNGFILPLDAEIWANIILNLINDNEMYAHFAKAALSSVQRFNYHTAAKGFIKALDYSITHAQDRK